MDEQHERILARIAEIELLLNDKSLADSVLPKLHQLREEVLSHFDFEETLMAQYDDGGCFSEHRKAHKVAISYINDALLSFNMSDLNKIMEHFANSILDIILRHDGDLVRTLICFGVNIIKES